MKPRIWFYLPVLITAFGLILAGRVTAQILTTLHSFTAVNYATNGDGANSYGGLALSGNTLYGTTRLGGSGASGTVFKLNINGTGFTNLHSFTNGDGAWPGAGLVFSGNTLFGTTVAGGSLSNGTVFAIGADGTGFTTLHAFSGGSDGSQPYAGLMVSNDTLYGTASFGGSSGNGTVFKLNTNGTSFATIHDFSGSDGSDPDGFLVLSDNILYGVTYLGGISTNGTVFKVNTDGTDFTTLHSFTPVDGNYVNSDGARPLASLVLSENTLYGTCSAGGSWGYGTVFAVNTDGSCFRTLHNFPALSGGYYATNSDGAYPYTGLVLSAGTLYGTGSYGGSGSSGTVFKLNTTGTDFTVLHNFTKDCFDCPINRDGRYPSCVLILSGNTLFGSTVYGGNSGNGTVFSIFIQPQLTIIPSGPYVILTWPTSYTGFTLQSTTNLVSTPVWTTVSPEPVVIGDQNVLVNTISEQQFYRLSQ